MQPLKSSDHPHREGAVIRRALAVLPFAVATLMLAPSGAVASPPGPIPFGVYDPTGDYEQDDQVSIEHIFLPWADVDLRSLRAADAYAFERERTLLVTLEPWIWGAAPMSDALRHNILSGEYDETMRTACRALGELQSPVTIRWAQEMDSSTGHFPWAQWRPEDHIEAFRRVIGECRSVAPDLVIMWSPAGEDGMEAYYPGDDVVDVIGLSVFGAQDYELLLFDTDYSFLEILGPRYERAASFGKPIIVAELGFVGDDAYMADWYNSVRKSHDAFPQLAAVIYFNRQEVWPWPNDFGLPDWRIGARSGD